MIAMMQSMSKSTNFQSSNRRPWNSNLKPLIATKANKRMCKIDTIPEAQTKRRNRSRTTMSESHTTYRLYLQLNSHSMSN